MLSDRRGQVPAPGGAAGDRVDALARTFGRRAFLGAALLGGTGVVAAACGSPTVQRAASLGPAGSDLGAVEHVVFLMMENRSFDHLFGTYRGVRGFDDRPTGSPGVFAQPWPTGPSPTLLPFHMATASGHGACTHDLSHAWDVQHECWNHGRLDAFVSSHLTSDGPSGVDTMGYYVRSDAPYLYALADAFTICDNYHCSVFGPTHPNRLMSVSGTIDPTGSHGGPVLITNPSPDALFSVSWPTMPEALEDAGVSWKVYSPPGAQYSVTNREVLFISDAILPYFSQYSDPSSALYRKAFLPTFDPHRVPSTPSDFEKDVASGSLPEVSWLIPPLGYDQHPPSPVELGEWYIDQVLGVLTSNPAVWSKTVLFLSWDENDGFFDHVPPPTPPPGTPGEFVTVSPLPSDAGGVAGPVGLGYRVPMLVVSPFSRGGYVDSTLYDHTSQLRFLEERFGVPVPNLSAWRRRTVGDLTRSLSTSGAVEHIPPLPATSPDSPALEASLGCTPADVAEIDESLPPYPLPSPQAMPHQEPGPAKRR